MKIAVLCFLLVVIAVTAVPVDEAATKNVSQLGSRYIEFPDADGNLQLVDLEENVDHEIIDQITKDPANNQYYLFTRRNPDTSQNLVMHDANSIRNSNFNSFASTIVIAHGWRGNKNSDINPTIRNVYLRKSDSNVIVVDWGRLASSSYVTAARGVAEVGRGLGQFLRFLSSVAGISLDTVHIVGFSMGAHLAGNAGRELGRQVARVTGLDPAGPLWGRHDDRLNSDAAVYVEGIHTCSVNGINSNVGHADFYPNGGITQSGCLTTSCSHNRAWELFAASVSYNHLIGNECSSSLLIPLGPCRGKAFPMGNDNLRKFGTGMFRVDTRRRYPF